MIFHLGCDDATRIIYAFQIIYLCVEILQYSKKILGHPCAGSHAVTGNNISKHMCEAEHRF